MASLPTKYFVLQRQQNVTNYTKTITVPEDGYIGFYLEKYEETLIKLRKRKAVWPQFIEWLTSNIESQLKGEMNLIDIEFESCSADAFDIMDWNNVIRICYKKTEFDKNLCIEISYSNDGGYTTSSSKTFRIIDDRNVNGIDEYSPAQILEIVMKHIRRSGHKIGEIVEI